MTRLNSQQDAPEPPTFRQLRDDGGIDCVELMKSVPAKHDFFIGFDSDGCVFDSMEIKHKECFCPAFIKHFNLQPASKYAREVWEFVNLYSKTRGCNRFLAVREAIRHINQRSEFARRGVKKGLPRFFAGRFAGSYQDGLIAEFVAALPDTPPWERCQVINYFN